ncbi:MAG TPA: YdeI/OmpD-associated family protein [Burkholderiaceae bacterium]
MKTDPRIDAYIEAAAPFAQPILVYWRAQMHAACPEAEETLKWSIPHFTYKGKILARMSAFKAHCAFGFWHSDVVEAPADGAMGQLGRITKKSELPKAAELRAMTKKAMEMIDGGEKPGWLKARDTTKKPPPSLPPDLAEALATNDAAAASFDSFPPSAQREYTDWITEAKREETRAKREETRAKRVAQAVEWMAEGKRRHWKYADC